MLDDHAAGENGCRHQLDVCTEKGILTAAFAHRTGGISLAEPGRSESGSGDRPRAGAERRAIRAGPRCVQRPTPALSSGPPRARYPGSTPNRRRTPRQEGQWYENGNLASWNHGNRNPPRVTCGAARRHRMLRSGASAATADHRSRPAGRRSVESPRRSGRGGRKETLRPRGGRAPDRPEAVKSAGLWTSDMGTRVDSSIRRRSDAVGQANAEQRKSA